MHFIERFKSLRSFCFYLHCFVPSSFAKFPFPRISSRWNSKMQMIVRKVVKCQQRKLRIIVQVLVRKDDEHVEIDIVVKEEKRFTNV